MAPASSAEPTNVTPHSSEMPHSPQIRLRAQRIARFLTTRPISTVPFVSDAEDGTVEIGRVVKKRAIRCALSRICGLCGISLEWGVTFVGSAEEAGANAFHYPPLHRGCAEAALRLYPALGEPVLGQLARVDTWALVVTGGFELERPASRHGDQRVAFHANAVSEDLRLPG